MKYNCEDREGMKFESRIKVVSKGGTIRPSSKKLRVKGATQALMLVSAATGFRGFDKMPDPAGVDRKKSVQVLKEAARKTYEQLKSRHVEDHRRLFKRVELDLGDPPRNASSYPTDERVKNFGIKDPHLVELLFQYGRYLMISGSRQGTQPTTLQGIWNPHLRPPWNRDRKSTRLNSSHYS